MAAVELIMPKMGESIIEATILSWSKQVGDTVDIDETVLEIATDKVDSEVPSPVAGVLAEIRFEVDDVVPVGEVIAIINTEGEATEAESPKTVETPSAAPAADVLEAVSAPLASSEIDAGEIQRIGGDGRFFSPLVRKIASEEGLSQAELESISGTGHEGRVNKSDILSYLKNRGTSAFAKTKPTPSTAPVERAAPKPVGGLLENGEQVIEMDRIRRLIAEHMVNSMSPRPPAPPLV